MMKHKTNKKTEDASAVFYDWWDALEFQMKIRDEKSTPVHKPD